MGTILFLVTACTQNSNNEIDEVQEEFREVLGTDVYIIEPKGYSLHYAALRYGGERDKVRRVGLGFSSNDGEKELVDTEQTKKEEEKLNVEYIYGPYEGYYNFRISIEKDFNLDSIASNEEVESKVLKSHEIFYNVTDSPHQMTVFITLL